MTSRVTLRTNSGSSEATQNECQARAQILFLHSALQTGCLRLVPWGLRRGNDESHKNRFGSALNMMWGESALRGHPVQEYATRGFPTQCAYESAKWRLVPSSTGAQPHFSMAW